MSTVTQTANVLASPVSPVLITSIWDSTIGLVLVIAGILFVYFADPPRAFRVLAWYFAVLLILGGVLYLFLVHSVGEAYQAPKAHPEDAFGGDFLSELVDEFFAAQALGCILVASVGLASTLATYLVMRLKHRARKT